jgi:hypothetical protein
VEGNWLNKESKRNNEKLKHNQRPQHKINTAMLDLNYHQLLIQEKTKTKSAWG